MRSKVHSEKVQYFDSDYPSLGRNYKEWFTSNKNPGERYNYLYQLEELDPWIERIRHIDQQSKVTFVITNNHAVERPSPTGCN